MTSTVLITGGSGGIGVAIAHRFIQSGWQAVLMARDAGRGEQAEQQTGACFVQGDVTSAQDCERCVEEAAAVNGGLHCLVNNAGVVFRNRTVENTSEEEWQQTFDVSVKGAYLMSRYALPFLRMTRGSIVHMSSYAGLVGFAGAAAYAAAKASLINLGRSMALDHAAEGIRVNCVCPGSVDTEMIHSAWEQTGDVEKAKLQWAGKHPLGRIAGPEEIASVVYFLASDEASFITGAALPVDGGITAG